MSEIITSLGLMSGTSMDGIDAAIIKTDGKQIFDIGAFKTFPYPKQFREKLKKLIELKREAAPEFIMQVETELTEYHITAVQQLIAESGEHPSLIGFHGHTIDHQPYAAQPFTWQIGNGKLLAERTGIDVVYDFRTSDVAAGGQGAPLMPVYHRAIAAAEEKPIAIVNIGGVANITYIGQNRLIAFDTGTGNALIDDEVFKTLGKDYDHSGEIARKGKINEKTLQSLMNDSYFNIAPPKSLDRQHFKNLAETLELNFEDKITTLSEFTVQGIINGFKFLPKPPHKIFLCGGGTHNDYFRERLKQLFSGDVTSISALQMPNGLQLSPDALEAQGFAYLAVRSLEGLPTSFNSTTGAGNSESFTVTGGVYCPSKINIAELKNRN
jgi:anhydro-N-acetylmuramic acid kinase